MRPLILLLLLVGCRGEHLGAVTKCGQPCYTLAGRADVGQCASGVWICTDNDETTATCSGQQGPSEELCDGLDNDCDGRVDGLTQDCSNACGHGYSTCVLGVYSGCTAPTPQPEVCDGRDNNCDGQIDEPENLPVEYCYTGPAGTIQQGVCRPGVKRCISGLKICTGEVTPTPEICNGLDDDCDGMIDEDLSAGHIADIVFVVDNSGSMATTIEAVKQAADGFVASYQTRTDLRWAIVTAPDPDEQYDGLVRVFKDFGDAVSLDAAMQQQGAGLSGSEATRDALFFLTDTANPLGLNWASGSKHVIVLFSDEEPQSYATPYIDPNNLYAQLSTTKATVHIFTAPDVYNIWRTAIPASAGSVDLLTPVAATMQTILEGIVQQSTCN